MTLRTFTDRRGCAWNCWRVQPAAEHTVADSLKGGWLCFQRESGGERFRLSLSDVPPTWEQLGDERLDLLRRVAETGMRDNPGIARISDESAVNENDARRPTPPRAQAGDTGEVAPGLT